MSRRRVVVTGLGTISPVGNDTKTAWTNAVEGKSGVGPITGFDASRFSTRFAGTIKDFDISEYMAPKEARKIDIFMHYGIAAAREAVESSGIEISDANRNRIGVAMGSGIGGIGTIEGNYAKYIESDNNPKRISPFFVPGSIINMISGHVSIEYGLGGPNLALVTACTTSTHCIGIAGRTIAYGDADIMIAGGAEHATTVLGIGGFCSARALSTRNDDPEAASRPWDKDRDGFVLSDGGACLLLEELEHAKARGATIYAELSGFGMSADAYHITAPPEDGDGAARCMEAAMKDAGIDVSEVDYVNAHGTSTQLGDVAETRALKSAFGDHATRLAVSSTKSTTGHLLGAAGAIEAVFSILALHEQVIPPTVNLDEPGEHCDLDYVPNTARDAELNMVISNSFGFGGTNGSLLFKRYT
ncbi:MAG: beta-ketoacyl-ACP synthase II [Gammaproteobacteria bacterium]|jgi:3-oxoacyl-[acyl-carrier-protein] synthase II|nr:beta-ketoacyl-ACP synthase II [Gammaproteobacteria bacterium]MDP6694967.1 beta-ketoacyl-ACP synthase II [Gammaproteobacteria bacterium]